jgi:hypothetical protein
MNFALALENKAHQYAFQGAKYVLRAIVKAAEIVCYHSTEAHICLSPSPPGSTLSLNQWIVLPYLCNKLSIE